MPPSAKKRLEWLRAARLEFHEALAYYAGFNSTAAQRMRDEIEQAVLLLIDPFPSTGRPGRIPGTFERPIGRRTPFTLVYREKRNTVQIIRVLHHARKYP